MSATADLLIKSIDKLTEEQAKAALRALTLAVDIFEEAEMLAPMSLNSVAILVHKV